MSTTRQPSMAYWQQVQSSLYTWQQSGLENVTRLDDAIGSLEAWLNEYPIEANKIQQLALSLCYTANIRQLSASITRVGQIGLDAALMRPLLNEEDKVSVALLALLTARANLHVQQAAEGQRLLDYANQAIRALEPKGSLKAYLLLHSHLLNGTFSEAALEFESAAAKYDEAVQSGTPLLLLSGMFDALVPTWLHAVFGNAAELVADGNAQATQLLKTDISRAVTLATLGFARTTKTGTVEAAHKAIEACTRHGLTNNDSPLAIRRVLNHLSGAALDSAVETLLPVIKKLSDKEVQSDFKAMLYSMQGLDKASADEESAIKLFRRASAESRKGINVLTEAICLGDLITANFSKLPDPDLARGFLLAFGHAAIQLWNSPDYLPFKAYFDSTIAILVEWAFDKCVSDPSKENQSTLSVLIDTLHSPQSELPPQYPEPASIDEGLALALDRIQRVSFAMRQKTGTAALILQSIKDDTLFITVTGNPEEPLLFERSGPEYQATARELAKQLRHQVVKPTTDGDELLRKLGKAALKAIPKRTQNVIKKKSTLLFLPDFRSDQEGVPFELFHDGKDFLGLAKVAARFVSLRALLRALEANTIEIQREQRALCVAAPRIKGLPDLSFADVEIEEITQLLGSNGWEVPRIHEEDLTLDLLLEAAELAGVVHIAAHGTTYAGGEALLLPDGRKLLVSDIENRPQFLRSFVFLNTCSLGQSRYLGGGVSKGIAYALVGAYTPCVIANLTPVYDKTATLLSADFYDKAKKEPVGEAMRKARQSLAQAGVPAAQWSSTIMIGNPFYSFYRKNNKKASPDDVVSLLKTFIAGSEKETWSKAWSAAIRSYALEPENNRLGAAMLWVINAADGLTGPEGESLARLAREISFLEGEAYVLYSIANGSGELKAFDAAIKVLEPLASAAPGWEDALRNCLAARQRLSIPREPETFQYPISINDQSDPAVRAAFENQYSLDQSEIRRKGKVSARRPEISLEDFAWNAVVIGQQDRFSTEYAHFEFATQFANKLLQRGFLKSESAASNARRLVSGFLPYLWESQHITHLNHTHALAQFNVFQLVLESIITNWQSPESSRVFATVQTTAEEIQKLIGSELKLKVSKYERALLALNGNVDSEGWTNLEKSLRQTIESTKEVSAQAQADCSAWIVGFLLDASYSLYGKGDVETYVAKLLMDVHDALRREKESWFQYYFFAGYSRLPQDRLSFLYDWRIPRVQNIKKKRAGKG